MCDQTVSKPASMCSIDHSTFCLIIQIIGFSNLYLQRPPVLLRGRRCRRSWWDVVSRRRLVGVVVVGCVTTADAFIGDVELLVVGHLDVVAISVLSGYSIAVDGINDVPTLKAVLSDGAVSGGWNTSGFDWNMCYICRKSASELFDILEYTYACQPPSPRQPDRAHQR